MRKSYPDDLNDKEWEQIEPILEKIKKLKGRPRSTAEERFSMPYSMCCEQDANGGFCRMTSLHGKRYMVGFWDGDKEEFWNRLITFYEESYEH